MTRAHYLEAFSNNTRVLFPRMFSKNKHMCSSENGRLVPVARLAL